MAVSVIGAYPVVPRKRTGLYSFDLAVANKGNLGLPLRSIVELYGHPNAGKSTLAYYLSAITTQKGQVTLCDIEQLDRDYISDTFTTAGFEGTVKIVDTTDDKGKPLPHETMLSVMAEDLYDEETGAVILDSVGAIQPIAEASGDFGEAFMGKRAKLVAQVSRSLSAALRNKERPSLAVVINHVHGVMGGRGHTTAGGDTLKYMAAVRIMLWTDTIWHETAEADSPVVGFQVGGQVEKLRFGGRGRKFKFYIVPGYGVHVGAGAMFDCFDLGYAEQGATVKLDGKSLGYIRKDLLNKAVRKPELFEPFVDEIQRRDKRKLKDEQKMDNGK